MLKRRNRPKATDKRGLKSSIDLFESTPHEFRSCLTSLSSVKSLHKKNLVDSDFVSSSLSLSRRPRSDPRVLSVCKTNVFRKHVALNWPLLDTWLEFQSKQGT